MNLSLLSKILGALLLLLAAAMIGCVGLGYVLPVGEGRNASIELSGWGLSIGFTLLAGLLLFFVGGRGKRGRAAMLRKDAIGIVAIGWVLSSSFAALPYMFCAPHLSIADAVFEGISGLTTTGATVMSDLRSVPATILLWRSISEWLGGLGILAMFVVLLSSLGASGRNLFSHESSAHSREITQSTLRDTMRSLWLLYIGLTVLCGLGMWALGMTAFQAFNHGLTTTATGGFGTEDASLGAEGFNVGIKLWTMLFMTICGISLPLYVAAIRQRSLSPFRGHEETRVFLVVMAVALVVAVSARGWAGQLAGNSFQGSVDTAFNVVSLLTTTGYTVGDYDAWPLGGRGLLLILMILGGCAGSTSGGLKVARAILWFRQMKIEISRIFRPHEVSKLMINGSRVGEEVRGQLSVIIILAVVTASAGSFALALMEPDKSLNGCISAAIACVMNIGPAFGEFGPTETYADIGAASKVLLCGLMVLGRLEFLAVIALFSRRLWRRF